MYQVGLMETDQHIEFFWTALEMFTQEELCKFIKFACNQERIPFTCPCKDGGPDTAHVPPYPMKIAPPDGVVGMYDVQFSGSLWMSCVNLIVICPGFQNGTTEKLSSYYSKISSLNPDDATAIRGLELKIGLWFQGGRGGIHTLTCHLQRQSWGSVSSLIQKKADCAFLLVCCATLAIAWAAVQEDVIAFILPSW